MRLLIIVSNTNVRHVSHRFPVIAQTHSIGQIVAFDNGVTLVNAFFLGNSLNIVIRHILLKPDSLDFISLTDSAGLSPTTFR